MLKSIMLWLCLTSSMAIAMEPPPSIEQVCAFTKDEVIQLLRNDSTATDSEETMALLLTQWLEKQPQEERKDLFFELAPLIRFANISEGYKAIAREYAKKFGEEATHIIDNPPPAVVRSFTKFPDWITFESNLSVDNLPREGINKEHYGNKVAFSGLQLQPFYKTYTGSDGVLSLGVFLKVTKPDGEESSVDSSADVTIKKLEFSNSSDSHRFTVRDAPYTKTGKSIGCPLGNYASVFDCSNPFLINDKKLTVTISVKNVIHRLPTAINGLDSLYELIDLPKEKVIGILNGDDIYGRLLESEESIFYCVSKWVEKQEEKYQKDLFLELARYIRFTNMSQDYRNIAVKYARKFGEEAVQVIDSSPPMTSRKFIKTSDEFFMQMSIPVNRFFDENQGVRKLLIKNFGSPPFVWRGYGVTFFMMAKDKAGVPEMYAYVQFDKPSSHDPNDISLNFDIASISFAGKDKLFTPRFTAVNTSFRSTTPPSGFLVSPGDFTTLSSFTYDGQFHLHIWMSGMSYLPLNSANPG